MENINGSKKTSKANKMQGVFEIESLPPLLNKDAACWLLSSSYGTLSTLVDEGKIKVKILTPNNTRYYKKSILDFINGDDKDPLVMTTTGQTKKSI